VAVGSHVAPVDPVPSDRRRLRRSGPPRPGTDRPAGHGKARMQASTNRPLAYKARWGRIATWPDYERRRSWRPWVVRGCPLATARVRCEWHGSGTADEDDGGGASRRRHQVDRRVRPVPETPDLLARAAGPRQPSGGRTRRRTPPVAQLVAVKVRRTAGGPGSSSSPVSEGGLRSVVIGLRRRRQVPTAPRRACWRIDPASCSSSTERL
jgi:hypothetical protein